MVNDDQLTELERILIKLSFRTWPRDFSLGQVSKPHTPINAALTARVTQRPWVLAELAELAEQSQDSLWDLVGLTKHCGTSLLKDLALGEVDHFLSHIGVTNT